MNVYRHTTDEALLDLIALKQSEALAELYRRHGKQLRAIILRTTHDPHNTEDVPQEAFMHVWRFAASYRPEPSAARTWLMKVAQNRAIDLPRSRRHRQSVAESHRFDHGDHGNNPLLASYAVNSTWHDTVSRERAGYVGSAMRRLPEDQRALIQMAFMQGYTHQELTELTGIPLGTVKTRIRTGIRSLRAGLRGYAEEYS